MLKSVKNKLENFFLKFKSSHFNKNEIILRAEDNLKDVFYLKSGYVRMYKLFEDGRELTLNIFKPGTFFEMSLAIANIKNPYFFQAITPVDLKKAPKDQVLEFAKQNPDVLYDLIRRVSIGHNALLSNIEHMLSGSAKHRIISTLYILSRRFGEKTARNHTIINLPLTHQIIASLASITRETATLTLNKLVKKELVYYKKRL